MDKLSYYYHIENGIGFYISNDPPWIFHLEGGGGPPHVRTTVPV